VPNSIGSIKVSYNVNSGAVRYDNANKEYLDRNFAISTTFAPQGPIGVTLYFTNSELQHLINEPNDGNADVNSVADLKITRDPGGSCYGLSNTNTYYVPQSASGSYDANSKFVRFNITDLYGGFFLHGGTEALNSSISICNGADTYLYMA